VADDVTTFLLRLVAGRAVEPRTAPHYPSYSILGSGTAVRPRRGITCTRVAVTPAELAVAG